MGLCFYFYLYIYSLGMILPTSISLFFFCILHRHIFWIKVSLRCCKMPQNKLEEAKQLPEENPKNVFVI